MISRSKPLSLFRLPYDHDIDVVAKRISVIKELEKAGFIQETFITLQLNKNKWSSLTNRIMKSQKLRRLNKDKRFVEKHLSEQRKERRREAWKWENNVLFACFVSVYSVLSISAK